MAYNPPPSRGMTTSGAMNHKMDNDVEVESNVLLRLAKSLEFLEMQISMTCYHFNHVMKPSHDGLSRAKGPEVAPAMDKSAVRSALEGAVEIVERCSRRVGEMRERLDF
jgi:hypothetical protein